jgi:pimeloyl-ACP methyl ester carboxylesterase
VLLHGQGFSRRCWDPIVDALAADRDVIAVDLPGHGDSPRQPRAPEAPRTTWPSPSPSCSTSSACRPCT